MIPVTTSDQEFCYSLKRELERHPFIMNTANVQFGESYDLANLPDGAFPRLEILLDSEEGGDYHSQRQQLNEFRFGVAGFLRTSTEANRPSGEDMFNLSYFGKTVKALIYGLLDKKQQEGITICKGFQFFSPYYKLKYEYEIIQNVNGFILVMGAKILINDTEV